MAWGLEYLALPVPIRAKMLKLEPTKEVGDAGYIRFDVVVCSHSYSEYLHTIPNPAKKFQK